MLKKSGELSEKVISSSWFSFSFISSNLRCKGKVMVWWCLWSHNIKRKFLQGQKVGLHIQLLCKKQRVIRFFFFCFLSAHSCCRMYISYLQMGLRQRAFTNQVWITLWHYGSESNLVNALLGDEILNLLKSHWQDYVFVPICMPGRVLHRWEESYFRPQGERK